MKIATPQKLAISWLATIFGPRVDRTGGRRGWLLVGARARHASRHRLRYARVAYVVVVSLGTLAPASVRAQAVVLEIAPTSIEVCPAGGTTRRPSVAQAVVHNRSAKVPRLRLETFTETNVVAEGQLLSAQGVDAPHPGQSRVYPVTLRVPNGVTPRAGGMFFRLYAAGGPEPQLLSTATIPASVRVGQSLDAVVRIDGQLSTDIRDDDEAGWLLLIKNLTGHAVMVTAQVVRQPDNAVMTREPVSDANKPVALQPYGGEALFFRVSGAKPGRGVGLAKADVSWTDGLCDYQGTVLVTADVRTAASELLTVLGVPTLLVLPGFLVLSVWMLCWHAGWRVGWWTDFPLKASSPEFLTLAILLSFLALGLSTLFGHDYRDTYRLSDLITLWLASTVAAVLAYAGLHGAYTRWRKGQLNITDTAAQTLDKLAQKKANSYQQPVSIRRKDAADVPVMRLPVQAAPGKAWVSPVIEIVVNGAGREKEAASRLQQEIDDLVGQTTTLDRVWSVVRGNRGRAAVRWRPGTIDGIWEVNADQLNPGGPAAPLVAVVYKDEP